tara:strand:- start:450 stop:842 length:393 start_codon:yes stop_codon:yes gene_type:complete
MEVNQLIRQLVDFMFKAEVKTAKKADGTESEYYEIQSRKVSKRIENPDRTFRYEEVVLPMRTYVSKDKNGNAILRDVYQNKHQIAFHISVLEEMKENFGSYTISQHGFTPAQADSEVPSNPEQEELSQSG